MAYAFVVGATTNVNNIPSASVTTTGASILIAVTSAFVGANPINMADSKGNTWSKLTERAGTFLRVQIHYVANPSVGTLHTFTATESGGGALTSEIAAFSDAITTSPFDQQNGATSDSTSTLATGSITPGQNSELIIAGLTDAYTGTVSINGGFTITNQQPFVSSPTQWGSALAYLIQTTATAANPTWTSGVVDAMSAAIASFKNANPASGSVKRLASQFVG